LIIGALIEKLCLSWVDLRSSAKPVKGYYQALSEKRGVSVHPIYSRNSRSYEGADSSPRKGFTGAKVDIRRLWIAVTGD
jgi:hypothetical protein